MEYPDPVLTLFKQVLSSDKINYVTFLYDGSANIKDTQHAIIKKAMRSSVQNFKFTGSMPSPTEVSINECDQNHTARCEKQVNQAAILTTIEGLPQTKTAPNLDATLTYVKGLAATQPGNKILFIFSDGTVNATKETIEQMTKDGYYIVCFFVTENEAANIAAMTDIFGVSRLVLFKTSTDVDNLFAKVSRASMLAPRLIPKLARTRELIVEIKSEIPYDEYEVQCSRDGITKPELIFKTTTNKLALTDLKPNKKYYVQVRGKKGADLVSEFSKEEVFYTINEHRLYQKIINIKERQEIIDELRRKYRNYKIPSVLQRAGVKCFNIFFFAEMGAGKSSKINTIISALLDDSEDPCQVAESGKASQSFTRKLSKFNVYGIVPIMLCDTWGWQLNKEYEEFKALTSGQLRENFKEGDKQDNENIYFVSEKDINNIPHAVVMVCDIEAANGDDKINKFQQFYRALKQENGISTLVAMTKLDEIEHEGDCILADDELEKIYDCGPINNAIEAFAKKVKLDSLDVFGVLNYKGIYEKRSSVKDFIALNLLDQIVKKIESDYKKKYKVLDLVDESGTIQATLLLESLDISLTHFEQTHFRKLITEDFRPDGFYYPNERAVADKDYGKIRLVDVVYDAKSEDGGYNSYSLKVQNRFTKSSNSTSC